MLAPLIPYLHQFLSLRLPEALWHGDRTQPNIALTFDDGPHPAHTPPLLKVLETYHVKATFFWLGAWVDRYPDLARQIYEQGHWIGLHGYTHRPFIGQTHQAIKAELAKSQAAIASACRANAAQFRDVRPPYGICCRKTLKSIQSWRYRPVMWSVVPVDWTSPGHAIVAERIITRTQNGSIIVLHDGPSGGTQVAASAEQVIPTLKAKGFQFVTIDQMWSMSSGPQNI